MKTQSQFALVIRITDYQHLQIVKSLRWSHDDTLKYMLNPWGEGGSFQISHLRFSIYITEVYT